MQDKNKSRRRVHCEAVKGLRPLTHGTPRETHIQKKAKIDPQETEAQPLEEVKEESGQNCSDPEDSSDNHPAQLKLRILKVIWKVLKSTIALTFGIQPPWRGIFLHILLANS